MESIATPLDGLKRQLAQLDELVSQGVVSVEAAAEKREALERQMIDAVLADPPATADSGMRKRWIAVAVTLVLIACAGVYGWRTSSSSRLPVAAAPAGAASATSSAPHATDNAQMDALVNRLAERLKTQPDDVAGWTMLARSYTSLGRYADALSAYRRAVALQPRDAQLLADFADGLATINQGSLAGEPEKLVQQALQLDPANVKALAMAGTAAFDRSDFAAAVAYWERAASVGDPASDFTRSLRSAIEVARTRAGLPPAAAARSSDRPASASPAAAVVTGRVTLNPKLAGRVAPDDALFVFASAPGGSKMPLAILRKQVSDMPLDFSLDDSLAISPTSRLSSVPKVVVGARISKTGSAVPSPGDWQALSAPVAVGTRGVRVEIAEPARP